MVRARSRRVRAPALHRFRSGCIGLSAKPLCRLARVVRSRRTELDLADGLVGDNWRARGSRATPDQSPHPEMQLNLMNARVIDLLATTRDRWPLAGDQLYVDFDLSEENVPAGTRLAIGGATIEVTAPPHTGCGKFAARFGHAAAKFVNTNLGRHLHLRGVNAKVVTPGRIATGDVVRKLGSTRRRSESVSVSSTNSVRSPPWPGLPPSHSRRRNSSRSPRA